MMYPVKYLGSPHSYDRVHHTLHKYLGSPHSYDWVHHTLHKYLGSPHSYDWVYLTLHCEGYDLPSHKNGVNLSTCEG
jgi:hypothetical protein